VTNATELATALRSAPGDGWIRAVGYHESVAGDLDRHALDAMVGDRPVRVQHRTGVLWVLNTRALRAMGGDGDGRLMGADDWLRDRLRGDEPPDLAPIGRLLAGYGVTGVTDCTPYRDMGGLELLAGSPLPQRIMATGGSALAGSVFPARLEPGPVKVVVADHDLPGLDDLVAAIRSAHDCGRPVAIHCVTRVALALALAAWDEAGARLGDRVEHGAVVPPELLDGLVRHRLTVVTQPVFVTDRGDDYLRDVDPEDRPHLYPCGSLLDAEIGVAAGTDAPYGDPDPWRTIAAAVTRETRSGAVLGERERVGAHRALDLFLGSPDQPAGPPRAVMVGAGAELCLLDAPLADALAEPSAERVVGTWIAGRHEGP
jgi:predicted amidohydrolase YtcJ